MLNEERKCRNCGMWTKGWLCLECWRVGALGALIAAVITEGVTWLIK
jgi:hypothetical protein